MLYNEEASLYVCTENQCAIPPFSATMSVDLRQYGIKRLSFIRCFLLPTQYILVSYELLYIRGFI